MNLYALAEPMQWRAGYDGGRPFYFDCAGCGAHEAVIAGFIGSGPAFEQIGVVGSGPPFRLALYCAMCFDRLCSPPENEHGPEREEVPCVHPLVGVTPEGQRGW